MLVSGGNSVCFSLMLGSLSIIPHAKKVTNMEPRNMFLINSGQAWDAWHEAGETPKCASSRLLTVTRMP